MRTKSEARSRAKKIVSDWVAGAALTGWIPFSTIFLAGGDMILIRQVADAYGVGVFDNSAVKAHIAGVVGAALAGTIAGELLTAIPVFGWIAKAAILAGKAKLIGEAVIEYFEENSPLPA
jgi:uncharacterized protein (DUF697 family)